MSLVRALTQNRAETDPHSPDSGLRGRTYAISFDRVWTAAQILDATRQPQFTA